MNYAQTSYTGNLGTQLVSSGSNSCDQYVTEANYWPDIERDHTADESGYAIHNRKGFHFVDGSVNKGGFSIGQVSGLFCERMFGPIGLADVQDGTTNTFMAGEVIGLCYQSNAMGWWEDRGYGNARGQTATPLNVMTTCLRYSNEARRRGYLHPECTEEAPFKQGNLTWGYRSSHPSGANFLMADGSVQFIEDGINYEVYKGFGARSDFWPSRW